MCPHRSGPVRIAVVGDEAGDRLRAGVATTARSVRVDPATPAAVQATADGDEEPKDCLLVDDGASGVDGPEMARGADETTPVVVLVEEYERTTAALAAGAAATLPRRLAEDDPGLLARRLVSVADPTGTRSLEEDHEKYATLVTQSSDGIVVVQDAEFVFVDDRFAEITGYDRDDLLGTSFDAVFAPESRSVVRERYRRRMAGESPPSRYDVTIETTDGELRRLDLVVSRIRHDGRPATMANVRDVTERKRHEREYEQIFDGVNDTISIHETDTGEMIDANQSLCDLVGYEKAELLDLGAAAISVEEEGFTEQRGKDVIDSVVESGRSEELEWQIETRDGDRRWLDVSGTTARIGGERRYLAIGRDVTERRRSERRLRAVLDRIDEAVFVGPVHELDRATQNPDFLSSGYQEIWGQSLSDIHERYPEGFFGTVHEDDVADYRTFIEEIQRDVETGCASDRYVREYRIRRPDGEVRWVHSSFYPTDWADDSPRIVIVSRDVTERKARERRMASFNAATEDLATADRPSEAAGIAVDAATETLGLSAVCALLYDDDTGVLRPQVCAGRVPDALRERTVEAGEGPLWNAFATGTVVESDGAGGGEPGVASLDDWRALALGNHGVLVVGTPDGSLDHDAIQAAHVLAATLEAALNHLRGQRRLAAQREELRTQTVRVERLERIATLTQQVEAAITDASDAGDVERAVCDRLAETGPYEGAWIAGAEVGADRLTPRVGAGAPSSPPVDVVLSTTAEHPDPHPAVQAWRCDETTVAESLVADGPNSDWRRAALADGVQSICAVPLSYDGITHGVLTVAASSPNAFGDRVRDVFDQLGTSVGYALAAIRRRRALESDETVELVFRGEDASLSFANAARAADCLVRHERTVAREGDVSAFFTVEADATAARSAADRTFPGSVTVVTEDDNSTLVEVRTDAWFGSPLAEYGAVLRDVTATPEETTVAVEVPAQTDVRSFVDRLHELAPALELVAKRQHRGQERTPGELQDRLTDRLTDRQRETVTTALSAGYFEWPRENDGCAVAERLGITQPTFNKHLRFAERKTFSTLFDADDSHSE
jgi:PAS domain S-box-containing protein